jgi:hypothetical protein
MEEISACETQGGDLMMQAPSQRCNKRRARNFLERSLLAFLGGKTDYTEVILQVKVTFLLNNYGDRIPEQ